MAGNKITREEYNRLSSRQRGLSGEFGACLILMARELALKAVCEHRFHHQRKWRFDFAWPDKMVAVECDGMAWQAGGGRHNTDKDRDKINTAVSMGWRVLRFSGNQIRTNPEKCIKLLLDTIVVDHH